MMSTTALGPYPRTLITVVVIAATLAFSYTGMRVEVWNDLYPVFAWMETTWFGVAGKTWGAVFASVQAVHLLGLAVLGGAVLVSDGRLLGLILTDFPARNVVDRAHKLFVWSLVTLLLTGVFMACGVALKIYYLPVYWYKMLALGVGILFVFFIKNPLLSGEIEQVNPMVVRLVAISSIMIWFTVAATGRWIGFSG